MYIWLASTNKDLSGNEESSAQIIDFENNSAKSKLQTLVGNTGETFQKTTKDQKDNHS